MLFSGLEAIAHNSNRQMHNLKIFEFGKTYHQYQNQREEKKHLGILVTGNRLEDTWTTPPKKADFFYLKAIVENLLNRLGLTHLISQPASSDILSEGISLLLANKAMVSIGVVKKSILKEFDIKEEVLYADFDWDYILEAIVNSKIIYKEIPKYPEVTRDYALLVDEQVSFKQIYDIALQTERKFLTNVNLFDVYNGENLPEGKKSYAVSYTLQDENGTLTDKQIDKIMNKLLQRYESELGAELR
jgi:phenylalanyl-tRNA synthetase beta chain